MPIDKVKTVKNCLDSKIGNTCLPWLDYSFYRALLLKNENTYLLVFADGRAIVTSYSDISLNKAMYLLPETYITINLNRLFERTFKNFNITEKNENLFELSDSEIDILSHIRTSEADAINFKFKDGKISIIEKTFKGKKEDFKSLHEIIDGIKYGEANIKIQNGNVTYIKAVETEKLGAKNNDN